MVILFFAKNLGAKTAYFEEGIKDKDIPEERAGEDSSGKQR